MSGGGGYMPTDLRPSFTLRLRAWMQRLASPSEMTVYRAERV